MSIGIATMQNDRAIVLTLRAESDDGRFKGDAEFRYAPDDPDYGNILKHLPDLEPGKTVLVPPWNDE